MPKGVSYLKFRSEVKAHYESASSQYMDLVQSRRLFFPKNYSELILSDERFIDCKEFFE